MGAYFSRYKLASAQIRGHFQNVGLSRPISPYLPRWELIFPEISSHQRRSADIPGMSAYLGRYPRISPRWELILPETSSHRRRSADISRMSAYLGRYLRISRDGAYFSRDKLALAEIRGHSQNVGLSRPMSRDGVRDGLPGRRGAPGMGARRFVCGETSVPAGEGGVP